MPPWSRRDFFNLPPRKIAEIVNTVFKEPIYFIVDMIMDEPKPLLPIPPRSGTHDQGVSNSLRLFGSTTAFEIVPRSKKCPVESGQHLNHPWEL